MRSCSDTWCTHTTSTDKKIDAYVFFGCQTPSKLKAIADTHSPNKGCTHTHREDAHTRRHAEKNDVWFHDLVHRLDVATACLLVCLRHWRNEKNREVRCEMLCGRVSHNDVYCHGCRAHRGVGRNSKISHNTTKNSKKEVSHSSTFTYLHLLSKHTITATAQAHKAVHAPCQSNKMTRRLP